MITDRVYSINGELGLFSSQPSVMPYPVVGELDKVEKGLQDYFEKWILQNVLFVINQYDAPMNNITFPWDSGNGNATAGYGQGMPEWWWQPSSQMYLNYCYYMQIQPNLDSNHLVSSVNTTNRHAVWRRGGRISSIIRSALATFIEKTKDIRFACDPLSPEAVTEKDNALKREKILMLLKPAWEEYIKDMAKMPQQAQQFETPEAVDEWIETKWKDFLADDYLKIAVDNWKRQNWGLDMEQIYLDAKICDCTGVEHVFRNGHKRKIIHNPWNLIVDTRYNDPFGQRRRFAGAIEQLTLTEAYYQFPQLGEDERKELYKLATQQNSNSFMVNCPRIDWCSYGTNWSAGNWGDMTITNVRVYWIAPEKIGDKDDEIVQTIYTAELLGGKYLMNYGKADNIIENPNMPYVPMLPLFILTPDMKMGLYNSAVTRDRGFQDDYDIMRFKQMEMLGRNKGMVAFVDGELYGDKSSPAEVEKDFNDFGFTLLASSGQANNYDDRGRKVEPWDRRLDATGFQAIGVEMERINKEIEMNLGTTAASLGESTKYIGKDAFQTSAEAGAMGMYSFDEKVLLFIQMNLDYDINLDKMLYAKGLMKDQALRVVGKDGLWRLQQTKEWWTRDYGVYLELNDKISTEEKIDMFKILQPKLQAPNSTYTDSDVLAIFNSTTKTQLMDKVKNIEKERKKEKDKQIQAQQQQQQQAQQAQQQHEKEMLAFTEHGKQLKAETLIKPKQEKLDTERTLDGLSPLHPELQQPINPSIPQQENGQQPPSQNIPPQ